MKKSFFFKEEAARGRREGDLLANLIGCRRRKST
jgi:hypothetical protein